MHQLPFPAGNICGTHFWLGLCRSEGHIAADRIMYLKNSNDTTGNRTHYLREGSAMSQPLCLHVLEIKHKLFFWSNLFNQRCKTSAILNFNTNHYDSYGKLCSKRSLQVGTDCLQQIRVLDVIRPFVCCYVTGITK
jgi:hypothetical protein